MTAKEKVSSLLDQTGNLFAPTPSGCAALLGQATSVLIVGDASVLIFDARQQLADKYLDERRFDVFWIAGVGRACVSL